MTADTFTVPTAEGKAYHELAKIVRERGWLVKRPSRVITELVFHLTVHMAGVVILLLSHNLWVDIAAFWLIAYGGLGISTNTHTSSHNATSNSLRLNRGLTYFGYPFFFGMAAHFWWQKHCIVHHPTPNVIGIDGDADLMPFFALNDRDVSASRGFARFFYRIQWILIPFVLALNSFFTHFQSHRYILGIVADKKKRRPDHWLDLACVAGHYLFWIGLPLLFFPLKEVLILYVVRAVAMSYAMFVGFAPAHFPVEAEFIDKSKMPTDYVLRQTATTVNFRTGFFGRLACTGVDYQIEHHLFPLSPHFYYPEMSKAVAQYCRENGYPYRTLGWFESVWKSLYIFYQPKRVVEELPSYREAAPVPAVATPAGEAAS
jgi:fatty acid desaturase